MDFELGLPNTTQPLTLSSGVWSAGGGPGDKLFLPGLPAGLFRVQVKKTQATLEGVVALVVGALPLPPGVQRLWLPGEVVTLGRGVRVRRCLPRVVLPAARTGPPNSGATDTWPTRAPTLTCVIGEGLGRSWALRASELTLGRGPEAQVRLFAKTVSRVHASLVLHDGHWLLVPGHAKNPTRLNGCALKGARALTDGDVLELGTVALRFGRPVLPAPSASPVRFERTALISRSPGPRHSGLPTWAALGCAAAGAVAGLLASLLR